MPITSFTLSNHVPKSSPPLDLETSDRLSTERIRPCTNPGPSRVPRQRQKPKNRLRFGSLLLCYLITAIVPFSAPTQLTPLVPYAQSPPAGEYHPGYPKVRRRQATSFCPRMSPSKIDRCSRSVFPMLFICFNVFYWSVMSLLSKWNTSQLEFVRFKEEA